MLEQVLRTVKNQVGDQLNEMGLSRNKVNKSIKIAGNAAANVIQDEATKGKTEDLMDLFSRGDEISMDNPIIEKINTDFLTKLSTSLNIKGGDAAKVSDLVIPELVKEIASSFNASNLSDFTAQLSLFKGSAGLKETLGPRLGKFFRRK
jgi:hypothetical protein